MDFTVRTSKFEVNHHTMDVNWCLVEEFRVRNKKRKLFRTFKGEVNVLFALLPFTCHANVYVSTISFSLSSRGLMMLSLYLPMNVGSKKSRENPI